MCPLGPVSESESESESKSGSINKPLQQAVSFVFFYSLLVEPSVSGTQCKRDPV